MASEPDEEAITNFVSFTSTTREQAIAFLKVASCHLSEPTPPLILLQANNLDSQKAINAYFEDPTGPQPETKVKLGPTQHLRPIV